MPPSSAAIHVADASPSKVEQTLHAAEHNAKHALLNLDDLSLRAVTSTDAHHH